MSEPIKVYSSEKIGRWDVTTTTRGRCRTNQVHRTDTMGPRIHGIHIHIRVRLCISVDGRCIGPTTNCVETIMDPRDKIVTDNTEKPKRHTINFRFRYGSLIVGVDCTVSSGVNPQTQTCGHVLRQHTNIGMN